MTPLWQNQVNTNLENLKGFSGLIFAFNRDVSSKKSNKHLFINYLEQCLLENHLFICSVSGAT
jgi:hypothetical protein